MADAEFRLMDRTAIIGDRDSSDKSANGRWRQALWAAPISQDHPLQPQRDGTDCSHAKQVGRLDDEHHHQRPERAMVPKPNGTTIAIR